LRDGHLQALGEQARCPGLLGHTAHTASTYCSLRP
jgi:hypothetical protein